MGATSSTCFLVLTFLSIALTTTRTCTTLLIEWLTTSLQGELLHVLLLSPNAYTAPGGQHNLLNGKDWLSNIQILGVSTSN